jgi:hypothetical protein
MVFVDSLSGKSKENKFLVYIKYMEKMRYVSLYKMRDIFVLETSIAKYLYMYKKNIQDKFETERWKLKETNILYYMLYLIKLISLSECSINILNIKQIRPYRQNYGNENNCSYALLNKQRKEMNSFYAYPYKYNKNNRI